MSSQSFLEVWCSTCLHFCTVVLSYQRKRESDEAGRVYEFLDASPKHCQGQCSTHLSSSCSPLVYEHTASKYLPPVVRGDDFIATAELMGGRMLVTYQPRHTTEAPDPVPSLFIWRL